MRYTLCSSSLIALAALSLIGLPSAAGAATETTEIERIEIADFRDQIGKVAKRIIEIVQGQGEDGVKFHGFSGPPDSNSGPGIKEMLTAALENSKKGFVRRDARLTVKGDYSLIEEEGDAKRGFLNLTVEVVDKRTPVKTFFVELRSPSDIARLLQLTGSLSDPIDKRAIEVKKLAEKPSAFVSNAEVRATAESKLSVALAVKPKGSADPAEPRPPSDKAGEAFVDVQPGEVYEIVVKNDSDEEIAAEITIDGLSVFAFSEKRDSAGAFPAYSHYIIAPRSTATIVGWYLRDNPPDNYASFLVSEYGKGNLAQVARRAQGDTGVVFVAFSRSFAKGQGRGRGANETGLGPPRSVNVEPVERDIAPPHEFVAIRYSR